MRTVNINLFSHAATIMCLLVLTTIICPMDGMPVPTVEEYKKSRFDLIDSEHCMMVGDDLILTKEEKLLNKFILKEKHNLTEKSRISNIYFPAMNFFTYKPWIETTPIFQIIKAMPKGAALHLHDLALTSLDWVIHNATYRDNVYMCLDSNYYVHLSVFLNPPPNPGCPWKLVKTERLNYGNNTKFDVNRLKKNISLFTDNPVDKQLIQQRFEKYFFQVTGLLTYVPIMKDYFRQALEEFRADNVQYVEVRSHLSEYYDLNGTTYNAEYGLNLYKQITEEFVKDHPDFNGAKIIMSSLRTKSNAEILDDIRMAMNLHSRYDNFLGYDLVGQEDLNNSLLYYINELLYPTQQNPPVYLPYYFHAAETNFQGTISDYNLVDAVMLNSVRIGHGYSLTKHPKLVEVVKNKGVAVEVNPLSNQVLGYVADLRNHPMASLLAQNIPVVISSDAPGAFESLPLSHDMYLTFMDFTGEDAGLKILKQLAINSLHYSGMNNTEKAEALNMWNTKWSEFVHNMVVNWELATKYTIYDEKKNFKCPDPNIDCTESKNDSSSTYRWMPSALMISFLYNLCNL